MSTDIIRTRRAACWPVEGVPPSAGPLPALPPTDGSSNWRLASLRSSSAVGVCRKEGDASTATWLRTA